MEIIRASGNLNQTSFFNSEIVKRFLSDYPENDFQLKIHKGATVKEFDLGDPNCPFRDLVADFKHDTYFLFQQKSSYNYIYFRQFPGMCGAVCIFGMSYEKKQPETRKLFEDLLYYMGYNVLFYNVHTGNDSRWVHNITQEELDTLGHVRYLDIVNRRTESRLAFTFKSLVK